MKAAIDFIRKLFFSPDPFWVCRKLIGSLSHGTMFSVSGKPQSPVFLCSIDMVSSKQDWY